MTDSEVRKLFLIINNVYNGFSYDQTKVAIWTDLLQDFPFGEAQQNLRRHIDKSEFPPTIADIKRRPDPEQAHYDRLREETQKRLAIMEEWRAKAAPPPWLVEGGKRPT